MYVQSLLLVISGTPIINLKKRTKANHSTQNHSEVPTRDEDWPTLETIIAFRDRVRARLMRLYADLRAGRVKLSRNIARTLCYTLEHEGFHVEVSCLAVMA